MKILFFKLLSLWLIVSASSCQAENNVGFVEKGSKSLKKFASHEAINIQENSETDLIFFQKEGIINNLDEAKNRLETILEQLFTFELQISAMEEIRNLKQNNIKPNTVVELEFSSRDTPPGQKLVFTKNPPLLIPPANNKNIIEYAYSGKDIQSTQGIFTITNAVKLYHTEPKALNEVFNLANQLKRQPKTVLLISQKPMCPCCSKLILGLSQNKRTENDFPKEFFCVSLDILANFVEKNSETLKSIILPLMDTGTKREKEAKRDACVKELLKNPESLNEILKKYNDHYKETIDLNQLEKNLTIQNQLDKVKKLKNNQEGNKLILFVHWE